MFKKYAALFIRLVVMMAVFTSCAVQEKPIGLAIVLGRHACANDFTDEAYKEIRELIKRAVYGGYISVIIGDGNPGVIQTYGTGIFPMNANNPKTMRDFTLERTEKVLEFLKNQDNRAIVDGNDTLGAIVQAERSLKVEEAKGLEKHIVVMDTGVSTAGYLNLQNILIRENSEENGDIVKIVEKLKEYKGILPSLEGIHVKFIGFADVALPQQLPAPIEMQLLELWKAVLKVSGASFGDGDIKIKARGRVANVYSEDEGGFPFVSTIHFDPIIIDGLDILKERKTITLSSEEISFKPGSDAFYDENSARRILDEYARLLHAYFQAYPDAFVYVVGSTAKERLNDKAYMLETSLSEKRAKRVKEILAETIPAHKMIEFGLGPNGGSWRVDENSNGRFDTVLAQANRKTMILLNDSSTATEVLEVKNELDEMRRR